VVLLLACLRSGVGWGGVGWGSEIPLEQLHMGGPA
jgi:hypothetical protein